MTTITVAPVRGTTRNSDGSGRAVWIMEPEEGTEQEETNGRKKRIWSCCYEMVQDGHIFRSRHWAYDDQPIEYLLIDFLQYQKAWFDVYHESKK